MTISIPSQITVDCKSVHLKLGINCFFVRSQNTAKALPGYKSKMGLPLILMNVGKW